jgi:hypothetical protein
VLPGDADISLGDPKSSLGDAESLMGDPKSSLGDAESLMGDAKSSLGDVQALVHLFCNQTPVCRRPCQPRLHRHRQVRFLGDPKSSLVGVKSLLGDAKSSLGDAKSSLGDAKSSLGDAKSSLGDPKSSLVGVKSLLGDAKSSLGDAESSLGDAKSSLGDAKSSLGGFSNRAAAQPRLWSSLDLDSIEPHWAGSRSPSHSMVPHTPHTPGDSLAWSSMGSSAKLGLSRSETPSSSGPRSWAEREAARHMQSLTE